MYMNQLTIIGFTGQDADIHYTSNGTAMTTISVATKESWKNDKGEWQSRTDWHRVVTFGKLAEYTRTLPKGTHVMVRGSLTHAALTWIDAIPVGVPGGIRKFTWYVSTEPG